MLSGLSTDQAQMCADICGLNTYIDRNVAVEVLSLPFWRAELDAWRRSATYVCRDEAALPIQKGHSYPVFACRTS